MKQLFFVILFFSQVLVGMEKIPNLSVQMAKKRHSQESFLVKQEGMGKRPENRSSSPRSHQKSLSRSGTFVKPAQGQRQNSKKK